MNFPNLPATIAITALLFFGSTAAEVSTPAPGTPDLQAVDDSGASNTDNVTSIPQVTFDIGGVTLGATVELLRDGVPVATGTAASTTITLEETLSSPGSYSYTARQTVGGVTSLQGGALGVVFDNVRPTLTIAQAAGQADPTRFQPINYTLTFSEEVFGFDVSDISLAGSTAGTGSAHIVFSGSSPTFSIAISNVTSDGTVLVNVGAGAAVDLAGNRSFGVIGDDPVTLDTTPPMVTIDQSPVQADPTSRLPINYAVVFSEEVVGFTAEDVSLAGSTANIFSATKTIMGNGPGYNVAVRAVFANGGTVVTSIPASAATDLAGNPSIASTSTDNTVVLDNTSPSVTIDQASGQSDPARTLPVNYTVVFDEPVTDFDYKAINFDGSTVDTSQGPSISVTGSGTTYNVAISNLPAPGGLLVANVSPGYARDSTGNRSMGSTSTDNSVAVITGATPFDFDGDRKTDVGIFRPSVAEWWISKSSNGLPFAEQFGATTDKITPADFTGDGKSDLAVWRPSTGEWYVLRSDNSSYYSFPFGTNGDIPVPADYDADGKADAAVFRPSSGTWFIRRSSDGGTTIANFGSSGDQPVPADYDGDGRADFAIFRPSVGQWWIDRSTEGTIVFTFGDTTDKPVQGDYTGDGKPDVAFWRPSTGEWFILRSGDFSYYSFPFGVTTDIPAPGDYDGDGKFDATVFRSSNATWYSQRSTAGLLIQRFGSNGDKPVQSAFVP